MIELIVGIVMAVFIIKIVKASKDVPPTKYDETGDNITMTYEEWEALEETDKPLSATKKEWSEINKGEKMTKDEYEAQRAAEVSASLE